MRNHSRLWSTLIGTCLVWTTTAGAQTADLPPLPPAPTEQPPSPQAAPDPGPKQEPKTEAPVEPPRDDEATVSLTANMPGITFHAQGSDAEFRPICTAPCRTALPIGEHRLALTYQAGSPSSLKSP